jgi:alpha-2-macroglobulin
MARFSQRTSEKHENHFEYKMAGTTEEIHSKPPVFAIHLIEGENVEESVEVKNLAGNRLYLTKTISGRPLQGKEPGGSKNLEMTVKYVSIDGKPIDAINVQQGTDFEAVITIKNPGILGNYENLALSQVFPSGWEILNNRVATATTTEENNFDYRDIRDDRVHTFFDLGANKTTTFKVSLNAAYAGKFYMPGISCQAMYDNSIYAHTKGYWVEVVK